MCPSAEVDLLPVYFHHDSQRLILQHTSDGDVDGVTGFSPCSFTPVRPAVCGREGGRDGARGWT